MFSLPVGRTTTLCNRPLEHMNMKDPVFVIFPRKTFDFNPNESNNFFHDIACVWGVWLGKFSPQKKRVGELSKNVSHNCRHLPSWAWSKPRIIHGLFRELIIPLHHPLPSSSSISQPPSLNSLISQSVSWLRTETSHTLWPSLELELTILHLQGPPCSSQAKRDIVIENWNRVVVLAAFYIWEQQDSDWSCLEKAPMPAE